MLPAVANVRYDGDDQARQIYLLCAANATELTAFSSYVQQATELALSQ